MRKLIALGTISLIIACSNSGNQSANQNGNPGMTAIGQKVTVTDSNSNFLGYVLLSSYNSTIVYSSTNYMYYVNWDGTISEWVLYFSSANCLGTAYFQPSSTVGFSSYGKMIFSKGGTLYKPASLDTNGNAVSQSNGTNSYYSAGTCSNAVQTIPTVTLTTATRAEAGIPATITPPIKLNFQ